MRDPRAPIEVKELLKSTAFATRNSDCDDHFEKSRPCPNSVYGISDQHVVLDSYVAAPGSNPYTGTYRFQFMVQGETGDDHVGVRDTVDTVTSIRLRPFYAPEPPVFVHTTGTVSGQLGDIVYVTNTGVVNDALPVVGVQSRLPHRRATLYFKELGLQSYADFKQRRHHFELDATRATGNDRILFSPPEGDGNAEFLFTEPIQNIHGLTAQFNSPDDPLEFPPDIIDGCALSTSGAGLLQVEAPAGGAYGRTVDWTVLLAADDRIFFELPGTTTTGDSALDAILTRAEGFIVGATGLAASIFRLEPDIDLTAGFGVSATVTGGVRLRIAKNRIRIPLILRRIVPRLTNYVAP